MESWLNGLIETISGIIWSQWATLGAFVSVQPCTKSVVDPEALLVATCAFGRQDARIFDEAMDWTMINHGLLKPWRLKRISHAFGPGVQRTLGAVLEFVAEAKGKDLFPGVRKEARKALGEVETEELFWREKGRYAPGRKQPDGVFLEWKLLRGTPRIRGHSGTPDLKNPGNLMIRLREYYGAEARADVMTYLLLERGGSSNSIATKVKYQQGCVYDVLENLVGAGIAYKQGGPGQSYYWIDREKVAASLGLGRKRPTFFVWSDVFSALHLVISDRQRYQEVYRNDFLSAERMRELMTKVVPMLVKAGEPLSRLPVPDIRRLKGMEYKEALVTFLTLAENVLRRYTID
jgi:hypothetical protein